MPAEQLERDVVAFVRAFGLHRPDRTPCGEPMSVTQAHALMELEARPRTQVFLAENLRLDASTVSRLVDGLVDRGWAKRQPHPSSRRAVLVGLTAKGRRATGRLATARRARYAVLLDSLSEQDAATVRSAVAILAAVTGAETGVTA